MLGGADIVPFALKPQAIFLTVLFTTAVTVGAAVGQDRPTSNLREVPPHQEVTSVGYCRGRYDVSLRDGSRRAFKEYDLAFKIDSSPTGPVASRPALVPTGRVGDRAVVVFAGVDELRRAVAEVCRD
jgi:hypothetical protein